MDRVRRLIVNAAERRGLELKEISLRLGKNHAYLQQFINRGVPNKLKEDTRAALAEILEIPEEEIGGRASSASRRSDDANVIRIPEYRVHVSAGGGALVAEEEVRQEWPFAVSYLREELGLDRSKLAIVEVQGDSMEPTLHTGDRVLVNMSDRRVSQPGIFILNDGDGTYIKRVEKIPASNPPRIVLISDNEIHGRYEVPTEAINIVGRVVWCAKRL